MPARKIECLSDDMRSCGDFSLDVSGSNLIGAGDIAFRIVVNQRRSPVDCISQRVNRW